MRFFRILVECNLSAGGSFSRRNQNQSCGSPIGGRGRGAGRVNFQERLDAGSGRDQSSEGLVVFQDVAAGSYHARVLAPGFAALRRLPSLPMLNLSPSS